MVDARRFGLAGLIVAAVAATAGLFVSTTTPTDVVEMQRRARLQEGEGRHLLAPTDDLPAFDAIEHVVHLEGRPASLLPELDSPALELRRVGGWVASLRALHTAIENDPGRSVLDLCDAAFEGARAPVVRQNLIFHVALSVGSDRALPWLGRLAAQAGPDGEDAQVALAFLGDGPSVGAFEALAREPQEGLPASWPSYWEHEDLGATLSAEARAQLRPYRALEVLLRRPYFRRTSARLHWVPAAVPRRDDLIALLTSWLERYPGHAGSDDVALYLGRAFREAGRHGAAIAWFGKALLLGDRHEGKREATRHLYEMLEIEMPLQAMAGCLRGFDVPSSLECLVDYAYLRRTASSRGYGDAVAEAERLGADAPASRLAHAWDDRWSPSVPRGLDSGLEPLPPNDPLRLRRSWTPRPPEAPVGGEWNPWTEEPVEPWSPAPVVPDLARQLRLWITLAELDRRIDRTRGSERADLLYKRAAVAYHDADVLRLLYADRIGEYRGWMESLHHKDPAAANALEASTDSTRLALVDFERLEREHPGYEAMDKVSYSRAACRARLVAGAGYDGREVAMRRTLAAFESFLATHPDSPLRAAAERIHGYWFDVARKSGY